MNKKEIQALKKKTCREQAVAFDRFSPKEKEALFSFCDAYKAFLDAGKTEREASARIVELAVENGFQDLDTLRPASKPPPKKVFRRFRDRAVAMAVMGKTPVSGGARIIASHLDSPRLDLKQNPLYQDLGLSLLKTHYYGGIRKYQWLSIPLALHGTLIKADGEKLTLTVGESPDDPVFTVSDLLPHLAGKLQNNKKLADVFTGEKLNLIAGSLPLENKTEKDRFKLGILNLLHQTYGLVEEDFISAEIEAIPAGKSRDIGFDRSMVGAYGQDDRVCAYTSLAALTDTRAPRHTGVALFFDKEEIGSEGNSGAQSAFVSDFFSDLLVMGGEPGDDRTLRKALIRSSCLSADVNAAVDPDFKEVHEKRNAARLGNGICLTKFTGVLGKAGSSDASAEFVGKIRSLFNDHAIPWQTGELGKIDQGGGGTVAKFLARFGMDVLDCGPALLSMHSPFEIASKADIYATYKAYKAFFGKI